MLGQVAHVMDKHKYNVDMIQNLICQAIKERKVISFIYKGNRRVVEPFTLGHLKSTGNLTLSAWWLSGFSSSSEKPDWKLYSITKISDLELENESFSSIREGYNPSDSRMGEIICTI